MKILFFVLSMFIGISLISCESSKDDKINKAQACLNSANVPGDAGTCLNIINGISGEKAARIRCALTFLQNGLTQSKIIDTFKDLKEPVDPNKSSFAYLYSGLGIGNDGSGGFIASATDKADEQLLICQESNSPGMTSLAHISRLGTHAQKYADLAGDIDNLDNLTDPGVLDDIPDEILLEMGAYTYNQYCNGEDSNNDICKTMTNAGYGTTTDPATLLAGLRGCFSSNTCN